ncbi:uncharacterized protein J3R85_010198 [Psidium guajava]|nr:uncharacterized protein J3R85_010198 [Psidium guajava]
MASNSNNSNSASPSTSTSTPSTPPVTASSSGKRSRDPADDEVYLDNLYSHKRYLSEVFVSRPHPTISVSSFSPKGLAIVSESIPLQTKCLCSSWMSPSLIVASVVRNMDFFEANLKLQFFLFVFDSGLLL